MFIKFYPAFQLSLIPPKLKNQFSIESYTLYLNFLQIPQNVLPNIRIFLVYLPKLIEQPPHTT